MECGFLILCVFGIDLDSDFGDKDEDISRPSEKDRDGPRTKSRIGARRIEKAKTLHC